MLPGMQLKLKRSSIAIDVEDATRQAVTIPAESTVEVVSGIVDNHGFVNVLWEGRTLAMFAIGLSVRNAVVQSAAARGMPVRVGR